jgi:hypothetical protein
MSHKDYPPGATRLEHTELALPAVRARPVQEQMVSHLKCKSGFV